MHIKRLKIKQPLVPPKPKALQAAQRSGPLSLRFTGRNAEFLADVRGMKHRNLAVEETFFGPTPFGRNGMLKVTLARTVT